MARVRAAGLQSVATGRVYNVLTNRGVIQMNQRAMVAAAAASLMSLSLVAMPAQAAGGRVDHDVAPHLVLADTVQRGVAHALIDLQGLVGADGRGHQQFAALA